MCICKCYCVKQFTVSSFPRKRPIATDLQWHACHPSFVGDRNPKALKRNSKLPFLTRIAWLAARFYGIFRSPLSVCLLSGRALLWVLTLCSPAVSSWSWWAHPWHTLLMPRDPPVPTHSPFYESLWMGNQKQMMKHSECSRRFMVRSTQSLGAPQ